MNLCLGGKKSISPILSLCLPICLFYREPILVVLHCKTIKSDVFFCLSCFRSFFSFPLLFPPLYLLPLYSIQFLSYSTVLVFNLISLWYKTVWTYFSQHLTSSNLSSWADFLLSSVLFISSSPLLLYCLLPLFTLFTSPVSSPPQFRPTPQIRKKSVLFTGIIHVYKYMQERTRGNFKKITYPIPFSWDDCHSAPQLQRKECDRHFHHFTLSPKSREHPGKPGKWF